MNFNVSNYPSFILPTLCIFLSGCLPIDYKIKQFSSNHSQSEPALSGDGRKLAFVVNKKGKKFVQLQDLKTGQIIPFRYLSSYYTNRSPSLSWNGRYIAAIVKSGNREIPLIEDLVSGKFYIIPSYGMLKLKSLSLTPDASQIVIQYESNGQTSFQFFDLTTKLEKDLPISLEKIKL